MFNDIPESIVTRMQYLEEIDARDRGDGTTHLARLRQIPPEAGRFIALLAAAAPAGRYIEIGTRRQPWRERRSRSPVLTMWSSSCTAMRASI